MRAFITILTALLLLAGAAFARRGGDPGAESRPSNYILHAGTFYSGDAAPVRDAWVVVRNGKVDFVRNNSADLPKDLPVVDRSDATIVPGFVASESALSDAFEERLPNPLSGTIITFRNVDPLRRAIDGFSFIERREAQLASGVTTAWLAPGRKRLVNGRGAIVKLAGSSAFERTLRDVAELSLSIGDAPENPPSRFEAKLPPSAENRLEPAIPQMPRSRAGAAFAIRDAFTSALEYTKAVRAAKSPRQEPPFNSEIATLGKLLEAKTRVRIRTNTQADIPTALRLLADFGLAGAITGGAEAEAHAAELKTTDVPVIVEIPVVAGPMPNLDPNDNFVPNPARTAAELARAGVRVAISPADDVQMNNWPLVMAAAARAGMNSTDIVRASTFEPARVLGISDRVGLLAPGRDADFVVLNGTPGEATTSVRETWIDGTLVFDRAAAEASRREARKIEATGGSVVVRAGLVIPMAGEPIPNGSVAIHNGKIIAIGREVPVPRGARVIDAGRDAVITPGMVDSRSLLGLEGDPTGIVGNVNLQFLSVPASADFQSVARAGITTALVQGLNPVMPGSPIAALKTGGPAAAAVIREVCGIAVPPQGNNPDAFRAILKRGKEYTDRWDKFFVESDKYKEEQKKSGADARKAAEKADAKKDEAKPEAKPEAVDPVTGTWNGELWGGPLPRREQIVLKMKLQGDTISGSLSSRSPLAQGDTEFSGGKLKDNIITITITRPEIPFPLRIEATIDRPDHLNGKVDAHVLQLEFEATRTEKVAPTMTTVSKGRKKGGPEVPPIDETLEPYRRLFKGDAAFVARAESKSDIETAITVVSDEFKLPLVIWGGADAIDLAPGMVARKVGALSGPNLQLSKSESGLPLVTELAMLGVPVAVGTESGTGAAKIVDFGISAVARGFGAEALLRSLTIDPARLFKIDNRVGSLEPGKDGDLLIWTGMPFTSSARVQTVVIGGDVVTSGE